MSHRTPKYCLVDHAILLFLFVRFVLTVLRCDVITPRQYMHCVLPSRVLQPSLAATVLFRDISALNKALGPRVIAIRMPPPLIKYRTLEERQSLFRLRDGVTYPVDRYYIRQRRNQEFSCPAKILKLRPIIDQESNGFPQNFFPR